MKISTFFTISFFVLAFLQSSQNLAQDTGVLSGKIVDSQNGDLIIGANVLLEGTTLGAATDLDGKYIIKAIPSGKYNIIVTYISYSRTIIRDVIVNSEQSTNLDIALKPEAIQVDEVIVMGEASNQYEAALLNERKKSVQISDGISAEQIKKSTDGTTAETLRRVPGLTLLENKYVYVRGVSERYNGALLNNTPLASSEPDKKDFAFDLIPSNLIENTIVIKSFTPDEPGDFAGGLVKINTVEFPSKTIFTFSYSSSYVNDVSTKSFSTYQGSSTDYLGIDDGFRDLPKGFPDPFTYKSYDNILSDTSRTYWSSKLNDKWGLQNKKAFLDQSFGFTYGDRYSLFNNDLGFIASLSYKTGFNTRNVVTKDIESKQNGTYFFDYSGGKATKNIYWGGIINVSYKIGALHKVGLKNIFTINTDDEVTQLRGFKYDYQEERIITALRFVSRNLYSSQLSGSSYFPIINGVQLDWRASYSSSYRDEPDYRRSAYTRDIADSNTTKPFYAYIPRDPDFYGGGRFYSKLYEYKRGIGLDLTNSIKDIKIKYGFSHYNSSRSFNARLLSVTDPYGNSRQTIGSWGLDSIYSAQNFEKRYIIMREYFDPANDYTSTDNLFGYYLMLESPLEFISGNLILVTGLRVENYVLRLRTTSSLATGMQPVNVDQFNSDLLPSFGLIYRINNVSNIRFSFGRTINRTQFREIAPFVYYNFEDQTLVRGNTELKQASIANYDLRFESFPEIGELISFSIYLKELRNPIERVFVVSTGQNDRSFANSPFARNAGFEIEYRTSLGKIIYTLDNFNLSANYSRIWSEIEETNAKVARKLRPMQGQSPYVINIAFEYRNVSWDFSANFAYNRFGKRIIETANFSGDDIYEFPRDVIDLVFTKGLGEHIELKMTVKDLLEKPIEYYEDSDLVRKYTTNTKLSLSVSYHL